MSNSGEVSLKDTFAVDEFFTVKNLRKRNVYKTRIPVKARRVNKHLLAALDSFTAVNKQMLAALDRLTAVNKHLLAALDRLAV